MLTQIPEDVSIQLMSPASGDNQLKEMGAFPESLLSFHSINVPSEWGLISTRELRFLNLVSFHSINVPSEWGLIQAEKEYNRINDAGFHSINVPSEWGRQ